MAPTGNDGNSGAAGSPVLSFNRAYRVAQPGQTVSVACGPSGAQTITADASKTSTTDVVFVPADANAACVRAASLSVQGARHLTFSSTPPARWVLRNASNAENRLVIQNADDVSFIEFDATNFYEDASQNVLISGGDYGPCLVPSSTCSTSKIDVQTVGGIVVENARFHDYRIVQGSGEHFECMIVFGGTGITIRNNTFRECDYYNIFLQHATWAGFGWDSPEPQQVTITGNSFEKSYDGNGNKNRMSVSSLERSTPFVDVTFLNNAMNTSCVNVHDDGQTNIQYLRFVIQPGSGLFDADRDPGRYRHVLGRRERLDDRAGAAEGLHHESRHPVARGLRRGYGGHGVQGGPPLPAAHDSPVELVEPPGGVVLCQRLHDWSSEQRRFEPAPESLPQSEEPFIWRSSNGYAVAELSGMRVPCAYGVGSVGRISVHLAAPRNRRFAG